MEEEERLRREKRNLGRRKRYAESTIANKNAEALSFADETKKVAEEEAKTIVTNAIDEGEMIISSAKEKEKDIENSIALAKQQVLALERAIEVLENRQRSYLDHDEESRRQKNAVRQRQFYWKKKVSREEAETSEEGGEMEEPNRNLRAIRGATTNLVKNFNENTKRFNLASRKLVMKTFWMHSLMRHLHPTEYGSPKVDIAVKVGFEATKEALQIVKGVQRKDHYAAKESILLAMSNRNLSGYQTALSKALEIKRTNIYRASKKRARLEEDRNTKFPMGEKNPRSDKISKDVREFVELYWESNTRISPRKDDIARKRLARKVYDTHQIHWLEDTEEGCVAVGREVPIGLRKFQYLKPYFIRILKDRNVCCCKYHVEMDLFKEALNKFRLHYHPHSTCQCLCKICTTSIEGPRVGCCAGKCTIQSVREWCEQILCPKEEGKVWHKKECIMGKCPDCGVQKYTLCDLEVDPQRELLIDWQAFETVYLERSDRRKKDGEDDGENAKRVRQVDKRTIVILFMEIVKLSLSKFVIHNFRYRWQAEQYQKSMKTFPKETVISSIDFSENYTFLVQDEIQSMHWDNRQISILVHATYRHANDSVDRTTIEDEDPKIITDYHFYISDDNSHDTLFVQHCLDKHARWMEREKIPCNRHWVWSDGCATQFKSCRPFYFISRYFKTYKAVMQWNFHASGHGKNVVDGEGGSQKTALSKEQLKGREGHKLRNAHDAVQFLRTKFALGIEKEYGGVQDIRRHHWEIKPEQVNRKKRWDCETIKGSRSLHCFKGYSETNPLLLKVRELSCFCLACVDEDGIECPNVAYAGEWVQKTIHPKQANDVRVVVEELGVGEGLEDWEEEDGDLADVIKVGDFFVVVAARDDTFGADFYVLQCALEAHICKKAFVDPYNVVISEDDKILQGFWYQQYGRSETCFVRKHNSPPSYVHASSVIHVGFGLNPARKIGQDNAFTMPTDTLEAIIGSLKSNPLH